MAITASTTVLDREKYLNMKLLQRAQYKMVMASICDKDTMRKGAGLTAYMIRYKRIRLPTAALTEGTPPTEFNTIPLEEVTVTMEQWGDFITLTDVVGLTTAHPIFQIARELLADAAARLMDYNIQTVMLASTNRKYGDLVVTTRNTITSAMVPTSARAGIIKTQLRRLGSPSFGKESFNTKAGPAQGASIDGGDYLAICGPEVTNDIESDATFVTYAQYSNAKALVNGEVGKWKGIRWVETNFIPKYEVFGNTTTAVASGAAFGTGTPTITSTTGGTLSNSTTYYWVVTRKLKEVPFEDKISIEHSTATGVGGTAFSLDFTSCSTDYIYNIYIGSSSGALKLFAENQAAGGTVLVTSVPGSGAAPPTPLASASTPVSVNPIYILSSHAIGWTGFYNMEMIVKMSKNGDGNTADPLNQKNTMGYKFFGKAVIKDPTRLVVWEVASTS